MPKCQICGKTVKKVYECSECGRYFCENCGDKDKLICNECLNFELSDKEMEKEIIDDIQQEIQEEMDEE